MSACQLVRAASLLLSLALLGLAHAVTAPSLDAAAIADKQLLDFGDVIINLDGSSQTVTFKNLGANSVQVFSFTMQPADAPFKVISTTCVTLQDHPTSATILATLQSCSVTFAAHPTLTGPATAAFNIDLNTIDTSAYLPSTTVHLKVNGLAPLTSDKPLLDFGDVLLDTQSAPQTVTVTNQGTQDLAIAGSGLSKDPGFVGVGFTVVGLGSSVLAPGDSLTMVIQATPVQVGSQGISIFVYVTQPNQPQIVVLAAHVRANALPLPASPAPSPSPSPSPSPKPSPSPFPTPSPKANLVSMASPSPSPNTTPSTVTVTPALLEFGNVPLGSSSGFKALTFTNTGSKKIHIQSVALTAAAGYQAAGFSLASTGNSCQAGKRLRSGASCTVWVKANPTVQGSNGANVYLTYVDTAGAAGTSQMALVHASAVPAARRALRG